MAFAILPFSQNKVTYRTFDWQILETDNFELYFYPEEEDVVREAAFMAERAYKKVTKSIQVYPDAPVLLFLYRNHPEFEQTNIISGYIGEGTGGFTEALKDRISLPLVSSPRRVEEVITHEFVHRIQFEVLYGGLQNPTDFYALLLFHYGLWKEWLSIMPKILIKVILR